MRSLLFTFFLCCSCVAFCQKTKPVTASFAGKTGGKITKVELLNTTTIEVTKGGVFSFEMSVVHSKMNTSTCGTTGNKIDNLMKFEFEKARPGNKIIFTKIMIGYTKDKNIYAPALTFMLTE